MLTKYETFVMILTDKIHSMADIPLDDITFSRNEDDSWNDRLQIICATRKDLQQVCSLHTKELFENFCQGTPLEEILRQTIESINHMCGKEILDKITCLQDYDVIKEDLFIRPLNIRLHEDELNDAIYREVGDIALVLYLRIDETSSCLTSMKIRQYMLHDWSIKREEAIDRALLNTYLIYPPRIYYFEKLLTDPSYKGENFMNLCSDFHLREERTGNCLSNSRKTNGAISIFLPGVARRIAQLYQNDYYIVFTSVHEAMIHDIDTVNPEDLRQILHDTIHEATDEAEILSFEIYQYCGKTGRFSIVSL